MEEGCISITGQKKYYEFENKEGPVFIKRNLISSEYLVNFAGHFVLRCLCKERMKNEAAAIRYVQSLDINIPILKIRCAFEDHGRHYLITDFRFVPGVVLVQFPNERKAPIIKELEGYVAQLQTPASKIIGGFLGDVIVPFRVGLAIPKITLRSCAKRPTPSLSYATTIFRNTGSSSMRRLFHPGPSLALGGAVVDVPKL
jgi:hypothetical protein